MRYIYTLIYREGRVRAQLTNQWDGIIFESMECDSLDSNLIFEDGFINNKLDIMTLANHLRDKQILIAGDMIDFPEARVNWTI